METWMDDVVSTHYESVTSVTHDVTQPGGHGQGTLVRAARAASAAGGVRVPARLSARQPRLLNKLCTALYSCSAARSTVI